MWKLVLTRRRPIFSHFRDLWKIRGLVSRVMGSSPVDSIATCDEKNVLLVVVSSSFVFFARGRDRRRACSMKIESKGGSMFRCFILVFIYLSGSKRCIHGVWKIVVRREIYRSMKLLSREEKFKFVGFVWRETHFELIPGSKKFRSFHLSLWFERLSLDQFYCWKKNSNFWKVRFVWRETHFELIPGLKKFRSFYLFLWFERLSLHQFFDWKKNSNF